MTPTVVNDDVAGASVGVMVHVAARRTVAEVGAGQCA
jgi:hypothetical protein